jgi:hypothetical protein
MGITYALLLGSIFVLDACTEGLLSGASIICHVTGTTCNLQSTGQCGTGMAIDKTIKHCIVRGFTSEQACNAVCGEPPNTSFQNCVSSPISGTLTRADPDCVTQQIVETGQVPRDELIASAADDLILLTTNTTLNISSPTVNNIINTKIRSGQIVLSSTTAGALSRKMSSVQVLKNLRIAQLRAFGFKYSDTQHGQFPDFTGCQQQSVAAVRVTCGYHYYGGLLYDRRPTFCRQITPTRRPVDRGEWQREASKNCGNAVI